MLVNSFSLFRYVEAARVLLEFKADPHARNPLGWTAVTYAALKDQGPMVRFLVAEAGLEATSRQRWQCASIAQRLDCVPLETNSAASLPRSFAAFS